MPEMTPVKVEIDTAEARAKLAELRREAGASAAAIDEAQHGPALLSQRALRIALALYACAAAAEGAIVATWGWTTPAHVLAVALATVGPLLGMSSPGLRATK